MSGFHDKLERNRLEMIKRNAIDISQNRIDKSREHRAGQLIVIPFGRISAGHAVRTDVRVRTDRFGNSSGSVSHGIGRYWR